MCFDYVVLQDISFSYMCEMSTKLQNGQNYFKIKNWPFLRRKTAPIPSWTLIWSIMKSKMDTWIVSEFQMEKIRKIHPGPIKMFLKKVYVYSNPFLINDNELTKCCRSYVNLQNYLLDPISGTNSFWLIDGIIKTQHMSNSS